MPDAVLPTGCQPVYDIERFFFWLCLIRDSMTHALIRNSGDLSAALRSPEVRLPDSGLHDMLIPKSVIELVSESVARENTLVPVGFDGETLWCATADDSDWMLLEKLQFILNLNVHFLYCPRDQVIAAINLHYGQTESESADSMLMEFTDTAIDFTETEFESVGKLVSELADPYPSETLHCSYSNHSFFRRGIMFSTIPDGKRALVHRLGGRIEVVSGPCRVWNWFSSIERMRHYIAHPGQYLSIRHRDGRQTAILGPAQQWHDPRIHESIEVKDSIDLAAKEAVVVYSPPAGGSIASSDDTREESVSETTRHVVVGPGLFTPQPGEWLHRFSWHASNGGSRGEEKRPNALNFQKLCLMPDQMYHDVRDVRTADDAVLTIRLMIFFELVDIEKMLDTTRDPIGDFINAATSDVVEFTGKRSFEQFKQQTEQLNDIATYAQLLHRAQQCGYRINNVVYRGYGAPDSLQRMHDEAIQSRTRLRLERATEEQSQDVEDYKLKCQMERAQRRRTEQLNEVQHDLELKHQQADADLARDVANAQVRREQERADQELKLELNQRMNEVDQAHFERLQAMEVDLTQYLTQARADQVIEVRGKGRLKPELHLTNGKH